MNLFSKAKTAVVSCSGTFPLRWILTYYFPKLLTHPQRTLPAPGHLQEHSSMFPKSILQNTIPATRTKQFYGLGQLS